MRVEGLIQDDIYVELLELLEVSGGGKGVRGYPKASRETDGSAVHREAASSFRTPGGLDVSLSPEPCRSGRV